MFDWYKKLFGQAEFIAEVETQDGRTFTTKPVPVIGSFNEDDLVKLTIEETEFKYGFKAKRVRILRIKGYTSGNQISGNWFNRK